MKRYIVLVFFMLIAIFPLNSEIMRIFLNSGMQIEIDTSEISQISFNADSSNEEVIEFISKIPIKFLRNHPNPFNPKTTISFEISNEGEATLEIFNVKGQKVNTLINSYLTKGEHSIIWDGKDQYNMPVSSGVYFYKVTAAGSQKYSKMLMLK